MCLGIIVKESSSEDIEEYYKKYLRLLYKNKKITLLLEEARNMHLLYPESELPLEWICKVYSEQTAQGVEVSDVFEYNIEEYYRKLESLNSESSMALFAKGAELFKNKNFIEACDAVTQGRVKNFRLNTSKILCCSASLYPLICKLSCHLMSRLYREQSCSHFLQFQ